jgi:hypothetical protein
VFALHGRLVVAHDRREATRPGRLGLDAALEQIEPSGRGLLADIKGDGVARLLGDALVARGMAGRTIVCGELQAVELACRLSGATAAWTLPTARRPPTARTLPAAPPGPFGLPTTRARRRVERAAAAGLGAGRCDAVCVEHRLVTASLVPAVHAAGGRLLAWTVDHEADARRLAGVGVDGLITNDPVGIARVMS